MKTLGSFVGIIDLWEGVKSKIQLSSQGLPKHVAIIVDGCEEHAEKNNLHLTDVYKTEFLNIKNAIKCQHQKKKLSRKN